MIFCLLADEEWGLRDYGIDGQIGLEKHPQEYIDKLVLIAQEIKRVLKKSGSFYLNLGDSYCSTMPRGTGGIKKDTEPYLKATGKHGHKRNIKYDGNWLQPKQLLGISFRVMIALQEDGWRLENIIPWVKPNAMPSSVKTRLNNTWEPIFRFVKPAKKKEWCIIGNTPNIKQSKKHMLFQELKEWCKKHPSPYSSSGNVYKISEIPEEYYSVIMRLDEYFDIDAIREPYKPLNRWGGNIVKMPKDTKVDFDNQPYAVQYRERLLQPNPGGKNPGDVFTTREVKDKSYKTRDPGRHLNPKGKNPGDVVTERVKTNLEHFVPKGSGGHYAYGGLDSPDGKHQNPKGKNPGDVVKHDIAVGRVGNFSYNDPLHTKEYHPDGKNPGDVVKSKFGEGKGYNNPELNMRHGLGKSTLGSVHPDGRNPGDFCSINTEPFTGYSEELEHFAVFPCELLIKPLKSSCPVGGIVLDPFAGRGTVGKVAKELGLHYILFDIKPEYCELARLFIAGQKLKVHKYQIKLPGF